MQDPPKMTWCLAPDKLVRRHPQADGTVSAHSPDSTSDNAGNFLSSDSSRVRPLD